MSLYLIADGGGTKTEMRLISRDGMVISKKVVAGTIPVPSGIDASVRLLADTAADILSSAGVSAKDIDRAVFFIPVLWRYPGIMDGLFPFKLEVLSDAHAVLWAGLGDRDGIAVLCGTGSFAYGRYAGKSAFAGGWGPVLGDGGSGFALGKAAIRLAISAYDSGEAENAFAKLIKCHFSIKDLDELKTIQADKNLFSTSKIAALCPLIENEAKKGSQTAFEIIQSAAHEIRSLTLICTQKLGIPRESSFKIALIGGVVVNNEVISSIYLNTLKDTFPNAEVLCSKRQPIEGAADYLLSKS